MGRAPARPIRGVDMKKYSHGIIEVPGRKFNYRSVTFTSGEHSRIPSDWDLHDYHVLQFQGVALVNIEEAQKPELDISKSTSDMSAAQAVTNPMFSRTVTTRNTRK